MLNDGEKGVIIQRDKETYAVAPHLPCGVVKPDTLRKIADTAEKYGAAALKVTSAQRIAIVGVREEDVDQLWKDLEMDPGAAVGLCVRSVKACPGTTFCKRGLQDSLSVGLKLDEMYHGMELPGKLKFGVSGCPRQCAETCIKDIGLAGTRKGWNLMAAGNGGAMPRLARKVASNIPLDEALAMIERIIDLYREHARPHQRLGAMLEKMDFDEFVSDVTAGGK